MHHFSVVVALLLATSASPGAELLVAGEGNRAVLGFDAASGAFTRVFAQTIDDDFANPGGIRRRGAGGEPDHRDRRRGRQHALRLQRPRTDRGLGVAARLDRGRLAADPDEPPGGLPVVARRIRDHVPLQSGL